MLPGFSLLRKRLFFQKGLFDETVDNNPMGLAELADFIRLKTAGHIDLSETIIIEQIQDIAYMAGIAGVIQGLNPSHCNFGRCHCGPVNQRPTQVAFAQGVKLPAAERSEFIDQAGTLIVLKGTGRFFSFFLGQLIGNDPVLEVDAIGFRHAPDLFQDDSAFQGGDIHISHGGAAKRAAEAAHRIMAVLPDFVFETRI